MIQTLGLVYHLRYVRMSAGMIFKLVGYCRGRPNVWLISSVYTIAVDSTEAGNFHQTPMAIPAH